MDTDDLTEMAYQSILIAARFNDFLKCELGMFASEYDNEQDYLTGILEFVTNILKAPDEYLESWNIIDDVDLSEFNSHIRLLRDHIVQTRKTPYESRGVSPFPDST